MKNKVIRQWIALMSVAAMTSALSISGIQAENLTTESQEVVITEEETVQEVEADPGISEENIEVPEIIEGVVGSGEIEETPVVMEETLAEETTAQESVSSQVEVATMQSFIFDGNGGAFSDGTSTNLITADQWTVETGMLTEESISSSTADASGLISLFEADAGAGTLRYLVINAAYPASDGSSSIALVNGSGSVLLDSANAGSSQEWHAVLREIPKLDVSALGEALTDANYSVSWTAVYSGSGDGEYAEPVREGYRFAGWYFDTEGTMVWDATPSGVVYANWIDASMLEESEPMMFTMASIPQTTSATEVESGEEETSSEEDGISAADDTFVRRSSTTTEETAATDQTTSQATAYTVQHLLMDTDGVNYTLKDTEHLTAQSGTQVTPSVKNYEGFSSPNIQTATIASDGSTVIEYRYTRLSYNYVLNQIEGADLSGSTPSGSRYYKEEITLKCVPASGYEFVQWSNGDTSPVTTFVMPAEDVSITPELTAATYTITYDLDGGTAENPTTYTAESETFRLNQPVKDGYIFAGWTGANGSTPQTQVTINQGTTGNLSFTATWTQSGSITPTPEVTEATTIGNVQTGDTTNIVTYVAAAAAALVLILIVFFTGRKKKSKK